MMVQYYGYYGGIKMVLIIHNLVVIFQQKSILQMRKIQPCPLTMQLALILFILLNYSYSDCDVKQCSTCVSGNDDACQTCDSGYTLVSSSCCLNTLQYCSKCMQDADQCDSCLSQSYYKVSSSCFPCNLANCRICINASYCDTCHDYYGLNNMSQCILCSSLMSFCSTCQNHTTCTKCINNTYEVNSTSHQCQLCSQFMPNCITCDSSAHCTSCSGSPLIILSSNKCINCSAAIPNCLRCTNANHCTLCDSYFLIISTASNSTCSLCINVMHGCLDCTSTTVCVKCSIGRIVPMGCTSVPGCTSVLQNHSTSLCISCDFNQFQVVPINGTCVCIEGHLAGQYCTEIVGCTNILRNNSGDFCITCNQLLYYYLENGTCKCKSRFQLSGQICRQICGDGLVFVLPCDDGNLIDGDGCSSSCNVENGYTCKTEGNTSASTCKYQGRIKAQLACIYKLDTQNTANILIRFSPFIANLKFSNFTNNTFFNFTVSCKVISISMVGEFLQVIVSYSQDFEQSRVSIIIHYDSKYIHSPLSLISTSVKECNGDRLIYDPDPTSYKSMITFLSRIISISVLILWLFGSYSHKLIGVETLHVIHIIFITQAFAPRYRPVVFYFDQIHSSMNLFQNLIVSSTPLSSSVYQRLNQSPDFIFNFGIGVLVEILIILVFTLLSIIRSFSRKKSDIDQTYSLKVKRITKIQSFIYNFLLFPTLIGFFFSFNISLQVNSTSSISKFYINHAATAILITKIATAVVFFKQWKVLFVMKKPLKSAKYHENYVAYYLTYVLILSLTFSFSINQLIKYPLIVFAGISSINLIVIIFYRPYQDKLHNMTLIVNQIAVLINLAWLISQDFLYFSRSIDQMVAFAVIAGIFLVFILSLLRIIFELRRQKDPQAIEKKIQKERKIQSYDQYQRQIFKTIMSQIEGNINYYRLTSQLLHNKEQEEIQEKYMNQIIKKALRIKLKYKFQEEDGEETDKIAYSSITGHIHRME